MIISLLTSYIVLVSNKGYSACMELDVFLSKGLGILSRTVGQHVNHNGTEMLLDFSCFPWKCPNWATLLANKFDTRQINCSLYFFHCCVKYTWPSSKTVVAAFLLGGRGPIFCSYDVDPCDLFQSCIFQPFLI